VEYQDFEGIYNLIIKERWECGVSMFLRKLVPTCQRITFRNPEGHNLNLLRTEQVKSSVCMKCCFLNKVFQEEISTAVTKTIYNTFVPSFDSKHP
jgi:hypothetical protein